MPQKEKNPLLALIGSFFFPGLGQVYNGEGLLKGLLYMIGYAIGLIVLIIPGLIIWIYGMYNAYSVAKKINAGIIPYKDVSAGTLIIYIILSIIIWVVFAVVLVIISIIFAAVISAFVYGMTGTSY